MNRRTRLQTIAALVLSLSAIGVLLWPLHAQINIINLSSGITGTLPIGNGGTGQVTATAAFDALSPVTTRGDLIFRNASNNARLAKGTSGQFLTIGANDPAWADVPAFTAILAWGGAAGINPGDGLTYYFGALYGVAAGVADGTPGFDVPVDCTLKYVSGRFTVAGTLATAENISVIVRKNSTTDIVTVTSTARMTAAANNWNSGAISVAVSKDDSIYMKVVMPTFVTNPTAAFGNVTLYFERP
jgi:hypothetical protein